MPSGRTHDRITIIVLPILLVVLFYFNISIPYILIIGASYLFASYMFNGDLDIHSRPYLRWWFLKFIWIPYQNKFPHRSIFTHGIIIGTIVRLLYILTIPFIIIMLISPEYLHLFYNTQALLTYLGLEIGSAIHTIADQIYSRVKKI